MRNKRLNSFILIAFSFVFLFLLTGGLFAQEAWEKGKSEGEFAVELVELMRLQRRLPPAPLAPDYISVLEDFGISPLMGWDAKRQLTRENYIVILAFASGKEKLVHIKAQEACDKNVQAINSRWQSKHQLEGQWGTLDEFLNDRIYFPKGRPTCPYGQKYEDEDGDHKVERHKHKAYNKVKYEEAKAK